MSDSFFDCNICFELGNNPVLTQCGHLFCWDCLSEWLDRGALDCPVCKSSVEHESVVPIYGRGVQQPAHPCAKPLPRPARVPANTRAVPFSAEGGFSPFISFETRFQTFGSGRLRSAPDAVRQQMISQFFIFLGIVMIMMVVFT